MNIRRYLGVWKRRVQKYLRFPRVLFRMFVRAYRLEDDRFIAEQSLGREYYKKFEDEFRGSDIKPSWHHYAKILNNRSDKSGLIVDVGAGTGQMLQFLRTQCQGRRYVAVEPDEESAKGAMAEGFEVIQQDFQKFLLTAERKSVDVLFLSHVVEHMDWATLIACLAQLKSVLRPKGLVVIETPNCAAIMTAAVNFWGDPTHIRPIHPSTLGFSLKWLGYQIHENQTFAPFSYEQSTAAEYLFGEGQDRVLVAEA